MEPKPPDARMSSSISTSAASILTTSPTGALVNTGRTERKMRFYAFCDSDLDNIGNLSLGLNALVAIGGSFIGVALASIIECMISADATRLHAYHLLLGASIVVISGCFVGAVVIAKKRISTIARIKSESRDLE